MEDTGALEYTSQSIVLKTKIVLIILTLVFHAFAKADPRENCQALLTSASPASPQVDNDRTVLLRKLWYSIETFWQAEAEKLGLKFKPAKLIIYDSKIISTKCGSIPESIGPFYCPVDNSVFFSLNFWGTLSADYKFHPESALAFVLSHEYGHHILNLTGAIRKIDRLKETADENWIQNRIQVLHELTADALAGYFMAHLRRIGKLSDFDIIASVAAARNLGDDQVLLKHGKPVNEALFSHGSSQMREIWFFKGYQGDDLSSANAFIDTTLLEGLPPGLTANLKSIYTLYGISPK